MRIGFIVLKAVITSLIFVAIYWIFNSIWGDGQRFTAEDARTAIISGLIFLLIYSVSTYFFDKRKLKRSASTE
jgi:sterol desaturase/sphingolipid hydroxylase (fatty acid hydroxylase superfamily)